LRHAHGGLLAITPLAQARDEDAGPRLYFTSDSPITKEIGERKPRNCPDWTRERNAFFGSGQAARPAEMESWLIAFSRRVSLG
jgi:hypothetical protein